MLEQRRAKEKGFLTLKEAAKIAGYTPDYVGQLIRAGKIRGEQVYCGVAWMTTREEIEAYLDARKPASDKPLVQNTRFSAESLNDLMLKIRFYVRRHATLFFLCLFGFIVIGTQFAIYKDLSVEQSGGTFLSNQTDLN